jgi:hypothetical protein
MSPARSKRQPVPHRHSRDDIVRAVAVSAGIVIVTALLVWLMRPGPSGIPATGGLMNRQPRSSWLVGVALGAAGLGTWLILRGSRRTRARAKVLIPVVVGGVLVAAVVGGFLWPGGLLRHDVAPKPAPTTTTTKPSASTTTTTAGGSGGTGGTGGSGAPAGGTSIPGRAATTIPATTIPATTIPATTAPASTSTSPSP